jgi:GDPmannose 4,6-dehydratase
MPGNYAHAKKTSRSLEDSTLTQKRALITGVTGQDGAYLAQLLLREGYVVFGGHRRTPSPNLWRLEELGIVDQVQLVPMDLLEFSNLQRLLDTTQPDEVYNLAAQSFVGMSFEQPIYTGDVDGLGVTRLLEAIRSVVPTARFYQASTSEMFGKVQAGPQDESTPFHPRSPYAVAKLYAHWLTINYRESYGMFACSGILFNHESPLRGEHFVTRKITRALAQIKNGRDEPVQLGNLSARRDWGFAGDYVRGMWLMLQQDIPEDYVLATGNTYSVREFAEAAATVSGFSPQWQIQPDGTEIAVDTGSGRRLIEISASQFRPADVEMLQGDPGKAARQLGWVPEIKFAQLVQMMVEADLARFSEHAKR